MPLEAGRREKTNEKKLMGRALGAPCCGLTLRVGRASVHRQRRVLDGGIRGGQKRDEAGEELVLVGSESDGVGLHGIPAARMRIG